MKSPFDASLLYAAERNDLIGAIAAMQAGANLRARDVKGLTAAIWFASYRNLPAVLLLAERNPDVLEDACSNQHMTPALWFSNRNDIAAVLALSDINPKVLTQVSKSGDNHAINLAKSNHLEALIILATLNPDLFLQANEAGQSAATFLGAYGSVSTLLELAGWCPDMRFHPAIEAFLKSGKPAEELLLGTALLIETGFDTPPDMPKLLESCGISPRELELALTLML